MRGQALGEDEVDEGATPLELQVVVVRQLQNGLSQSLLELVVVVVVVVVVVMVVVVVWVDDGGGGGGECGLMVVYSGL